MAIVAGQRRGGQHQARFPKTQGFGDQVLDKIRSLLVAACPALFSQRTKWDN